MVSRSSSRPTSPGPVGCTRANGFTRVNERTRAGACSPSRSATQAPSESPTTCAGSPSISASTAATSSAMLSIVTGPRAFVDSP
jgi:hypothetical protein